MGSTPVTTDNASCFDVFWLTINTSATDSVIHIVCFSPKNEKCLGEEAAVSLSCSLWCLCVSYAALLTSLTLLSWTVPLGQQWPAWDHGEVVVVAFFNLFVIHNVSRHTVSFSFSVVLTAVPLQLDIERWVWNIV